MHKAANLVRSPGNYRAKMHGSPWKKDRSWSDREAPATTIRSIIVTRWNDRETPKRLTGGRSRTCDPKIGCGEDDGNDTSPRERNSKPLIWCHVPRRCSLKVIPNSNQRSERLIGGITSSWYRRFMLKYNSIPRLARSIRPRLMTLKYTPEIFFRDNFKH